MCGVSKWVEEKKKGKRKGEDVSVWMNGWMLG